MLPPPPPPSGVCDYGTDHYRKEAARGVSREKKKIYGSERGKKNSNNTRQKNQVQFHVSAAEGKKRRRKQRMRQSMRPISVLKPKLRPLVLHPITSAIVSQCFLRRCCTRTTVLGWRTDRGLACRSCCALALAASVVAARSRASRCSRHCYWNALGCDNTFDRSMHLNSSWDGLNPWARGVLLNSRRPVLKTLSKGLYCFHSDSSFREGL